MRALGKGDRVQHRRALVAKDRESSTNRAGRFVVAIAAWRVEIDTGAGDERDRPLHRSDDLTERDLLRRAREPIAALGPPCALHQPRLLEVEHDELEIFGRHTLGFGDSGELNWRAALLFREEKQRTERVAGFLCDHGEREPSAAPAPTQSRAPTR